MQMAELLLKEIKDTASRADVLVKFCA